MIIPTALALAMSLPQATGFEGHLVQEVSGSRPADGKGSPRAHPPSADVSFPGYTLHTWLSKDGRVRTEVQSSSKLGQLHVDTLVLPKQGRAVLLHHRDRTWSEVSLKDDPAGPSADSAEYEVVVLGKEKILGYPTVHVRMIEKGRDGHTSEFWLTDALGGTPNEQPFDDALQRAGVKGRFPLRFVKRAGPDFELRLETKKIKLGKVPPEKLRVPAGYKKGADLTKLLGPANLLGGSDAVERPSGSPLGAPPAKPSTPAEIEQRRAEMLSSAVRMMMMSARRVQQACKAGVLTPAECGKAKEDLLRAGRRTLTPSERAELTRALGM